MTYGEGIELDGIVQKISDAEQKVSTLEAALSNPSALSGPDELAETAARLSEAQSALDTLNQRWEYLELKREESK